MKPEPPSSTDKAVERDIASHIFSTSAMMMGLCLTVISLMDVRSGTNRLATVVDDIIALDALFFLVSCFLSYGALRSRRVRRMHHVEAFADGVFLIGMAGMGVACVLFVWTIF
ncbi:hypothetical protein [Brevifollis gellanilyticus]|uniref:Uncharacterized protein n=1 Tax=Brevifollis gellanilyticus TaxID=748831 RepID=A0A512MF00_9BACT|nr:hypothetical protein [Brevifollis gellanilyticus]GEP45324.1 hypothetical protein BGE01nite_46150 [Brevifollis gellanilyticus]